MRTVIAPLSLAGLLLVSSSTLLACASDTTNAATNIGPNSDAGDAPACAEGATRCEGAMVATCSGGAFGAPASCEGEAVCREGACRAPTEQQLAQAKELASMLRFLQDETAWHSPVDWDALRLIGRKSILGGDGSELAYFTALYRAFVAVPQGHQGLYLTSGCGKLVAYSSYSQRGVCGQPHARGIVVTNARPNNALGLQKGDLVTRVDAGGGVLDALADRPMCTSSRPSTSNRDAVTATTFSDLLRPGEQIAVESPDGTTRTVTVPDAPLTGALASALWCGDPFSRDSNIPVSSELRADGVGVIRLPGFTDPQQSFPKDPNAIAEYQAKFEDKIQTEFDKVKSASKLVWDVRGNPGGLTLVALKIASGFPGARSDQISYCEARNAKSDPPSFGSLRYAEYALTPGGPFAYAGKVAVLTDGLDYSAADYFPLAVKTRTNALLVGKPSAGAFGATSKSKAFDGPPAFSVAVDVNRCSSADDGVPLEGKGVTPHVTADYDPKDLAAGKDTVLERAIVELQ